MAPRRIISSTLTRGSRSGAKQAAKPDADIERARDRTRRTQRHLDRIKADDELEREAIRILSGQ
jgi:hypothetical protein